ncbi:MAG: DUF2207 domain-containing protein [Gammaproteobacteria bacterium]
MKVLRLLLVGWLLTVSASVTQAEESILLFDSDVTIAADGSMQVIETIRVRAEGNQIRRGIYRDFPTDYTDRLGNRYRVGFEVLSVRRDRLTEPYHIEKLDNGVRIYLGSAETFLPAGDYEYQLTYGTDRQLGFFENHDELYWNVTGLGWDFPIAQARARVTLPKPASQQQLTVEGYTGPRGSTGQDYRATVFDGGVTIQTTRVVGPRENLTLVVTWPKGIVAEPSTVEKLTALLADNAGLLLALMSLLAGTGYLVFAWNRAGRDPSPGVIFPRYEPPKGFSPASIRYVDKMGYDKKAFTAAVISLAVKGFMSIERSSGTYTLRRLEHRADPSQLAAGEKVLLGELFKSGTKLELEDENHGPIGKAIRAHGRALKRDYHKKYFLTNTVLLMPAWILLIISVALVVMLQLGSFLVFATYAISLVLLFTFTYLMKAPTPAGRRLMDKAQVFKLYLELAEKDELNLRNPPDKTPELFERYLPYALALSVEQPWAEQFAGIFEQLQRETGTDYRPNWYNGRFNSRDPVRFAADIGGGLNSAISSASTPPGSSSGSGGGSSGGGGGGGGGGGW